METIKLFKNLLYKFYKKTGLSYQNHETTILIRLVKSSQCVSWAIKNAAYRKVQSLRIRCNEAAGNNK